MDNIQNNYDLTEIIAKAFIGEANKLMPYLDVSCIYHSDYANKTVVGAKAIVDNLEKIHRNVTEDLQYYYEIVHIAFQKLIVDI